MLKKMLNRFGFITKREASRLVKRSYFAAAQNNRLTNDWVTSGASPDGELIYELATIRRRARELSRNNDYAKKFLNLCIQNIIGADGFVLQNKAKDDNGTFDNLANTIIENAFYDWCKPENCTVTGLLSFKQAEDLIIKTVARDGELFIRKVFNKNFKYGFKIQLIEADYISELLNRTLGNGNIVRMGVELDEWRKPVAYYIKNITASQELYSYQLSASYNDYIRVDASEIYHLGDPERINQTRYYSWLAASMYRLRMLSGFEEASLVNARASASKMGFFKTQTDALYKGETSDAQGNVITNAEPGTFEQLPPGMDFIAYDPKYPSDQHEPFVKSILRAIASGLGVSYNTLANDLEGVNYSSIRAGLLDERENWKRLQSWFVDAFLNPLFSDWLSNSLAFGAILIAGKPLPLSKFEKFNQPLWIGRRWQWVDPLKDITANVLAIKNGLKTNQQALAEQGSDIYDTYEQLAEEIKLQEKYGLTLGDNNNGTTGQTQDANNASNDASNAAAKNGRKNNRTIPLFRAAV